MNRARTPLELFELPPLDSEEPSQPPSSAFKEFAAAQRKLLEEYTQACAHPALAICLETLMR